MYNVPTNWYFFWYSITTTRLSWYLIYLLVFNFSVNAARIITKCKGIRYNSELILFKIDKISRTYVNKRKLLVLVLGWAI